MIKEWKNGVLMLSGLNATSIMRPCSVPAPMVF
jgi:hypothetical protein